jgi:hypothetical protein
MKSQFAYPKPKLFKDSWMTAILTARKVVGLPLHWSEAALLRFRRIELVGGSMFVDIGGS